MRTIGTVVRGVRAPIIKAGDDLAQIVVDSILAAQKEEGFKFRDKDIVAITEAVVGKASIALLNIVDGLANKLADKVDEMNLDLENFDIGQLQNVLQLLNIEK